MTAEEWVVESCLLDILWVLDSDEILQEHSSAARNHVYKTNSNDSLIHIHSTWPLPVADLGEGPGESGGESGQGSPCVPVHEAT